MVCVFFDLSKDFDYLPHSLIYTHVGGSGAALGTCSKSSSESDSVWC